MVSWPILPGCTPSEVATRVPNAERKGVYMSETPTTADEREVATTCNAGTTESRMMSPLMPLVPDSPVGGKGQVLFTFQAGRGLISTNFGLGFMLLYSVSMKYW